MLSSADPVTGFSFFLFAFISFSLMSALRTHRASCLFDVRRVCVLAIYRWKKIGSLYVLHRLDIFFLPPSFFLFFGADLFNPLHNPPEITQWVTYTADPVAPGHVRRLGH